MGDPSPAAQDAGPSPVTPPTYGEYVWECGRIGRWRDAMVDRVVMEAADPDAVLARLHARHDALVDEAWAAYEAGVALPRRDLPTGPAPKPPATTTTTTKAPGPAAPARGGRTSRSAR